MTEVMIFRINIPHMLLGLLVCFSILEPAVSQRRTDGGNQYVFFETINLPSDIPGKGRLDINFRVSKAFFIFTRTAAAGAPAEFSAAAEITIEIFDEQGRSAGREITERRLYTDNPRLELADAGFLEGLFSFTLSPAEYRFFIQVRDKNSARLYRDRNMTARVRAFPENVLQISDVVFLEPIEGEQPTSIFIPLNLGGNVFFGRNFDGYIEFSSSADPDFIPKVIASLYRVIDGRRDTEILHSDTLSEDNFNTGKKLEIVAEEESYLYRIIDSERPDRRSAFLNLRGEQLPEGIYRLEITVDDGNDRKNHMHNFRVTWFDKPMSLRNFDFAFEMLSYIVPDEEYRQLRRGSVVERQKKFEQFWKAKDPLPDRAFNPVKTEFYLRVDYAAREFQSIREPNGARTDRGKVYIVYGPPDTIDRVLTPGQHPQESWIYRHLRQKFIFTDPARNGSYRLTTREDI